MPLLARLRHDVMEFTRPSSPGVFARARRRSTRAHARVLGPLLAVALLLAGAPSAWGDSAAHHDGWNVAPAAASPLLAYPAAAQRSMSGARAPRSPWSGPGTALDIAARAWVQPGAIANDSPPPHERSWAAAPGRRGYDATAPPSR